MGVYGPDFSQCVWGEDGGWGNGGDGRRLRGISGFSCSALRDGEE